MYILKEDVEVDVAKEALPVSFLTDMVSKGWDEVGYLKEASSAIREQYSDTAAVETLMQDLMDAYLVFIGQLELYLHKEENIVATAEPAAVATKPVDMVPMPKPELPEAELDVEPISGTVDKVDVEPEDDADDESEDDEEDDEEDEEEIIKPAKRATATTDEPFEFFVDFDEPDMSEPPITDADLYADAPTGKKALRS